MNRTDTSQYALIIDDCTKGERTPLSRACTQPVAVTLELHDLRNERVITTVHADDQGEARRLLTRNLISQGWKPEDANVFAVRH